MEGAGGIASLYLLCAVAKAGDVTSQRGLRNLKSSGSDLF
jgi:hypothetical protein